MNKKKKSIEKGKEKPKGEVTPTPLEPVEKPFDFGGLPSRDLKKSLGCG